MIRVERFDEYGQPLRPGTRSEHHHNLKTVSFRIFATLDQVDPDEWHAEVLLFDEVIDVTVGPFPSEHAAGAAAENALRERLLRVFREDR